MHEKIEKDLANDVDVIKRLLILLLKKFDVDQREIAKILGITPGRLSQLINPKKYK
jgi:plasmid maintenance system antidote protein VapI